VDDEWCFKRWINGESIEAMAAEFLVDENTLRKRMKKAVGLVDYKEGVKLAKEHREILKNGELKRILALGRKKTLELLHSNKIDDVKSLCRIEKVYGDRLALAENRPTEIQDRKVQIVSFKDLSQEEMAEQV
jgi:hypothetical protein